MWGVTRCISFTNLLQIVLVLIFGNKISLFEHTKNQKAFEGELARAQKKGIPLDQVLELSVTKKESDKNVEQTQPQHRLKVGFSLNNFSCTSNRSQKFHTGKTRRICSRVCAISKNRRRARLYCCWQKTRGSGG
jgi:hypothetical protein